MVQTDASRAAVCACVRACVRACVFPQHLLKHEGELHAVSGDAAGVQETVQLEIKLPAGVAFVCAGREPESTVNVGGQRPSGQLGAVKVTSGGGGGCYLSNLASTSATTARLSIAFSVLWLRSNRANMFLLSSMARPRISFSTT